ncbi:RNA polymerase sigma factor [Planctomycetota bacterium]
MVENISTKSDEDLMLLYAKKGNFSAMEELVNRYQHRLYNFALRYLSNITEAEEALQDSFLALVRSAKQFKRADSFQAWIFRIMANRCVDIKRRQASGSRINRELVMQSRTQKQHSPVWDAQKAEMLNALNREVGQLPADIQKAMLLYWYEGMTQQEIAASLNCSQKTVSKRIESGMKTLQKRFSGTAYSTVIVSAALLIQSRPEQTMQAKVLIAMLETLHSQSILSTAAASASTLTNSMTAGGILMICKNKIAVISFFVISILLSGTAGYVGGQAWLPETALIINETVRTQNSETDLHSLSDLRQTLAGLQNENEKLQHTFASIEHKNAELQVCIRESKTAVQLDYNAMMTDPEQSLALMKTFGRLHAELEDMVSQAQDADKEPELPEDKLDEYIQLSRLLKKYVFKPGRQQDQLLQLIQEEDDWNIYYGYLDLIGSTDYVPGNHSMGVADISAQLALRLLNMAFDIQLGGEDKSRRILQTIHLTTQSYDENTLKIFFDNIFTRLPDIDNKLFRYSIYGTLFHGIHRNKFHPFLFEPQNINVISQQLQEEDALNKASIVKWILDTDIPDQDKLFAEAIAELEKKPDEDFINLYALHFLRNSKNLPKSRLSILHSTLSKSLISHFSSETKRQLLKGLFSLSEDMTVTAMESALHSESDPLLYKQMQKAISEHEKDLLSLQSLTAILSEKE